MVYVPAASTSGLNTIPMLLARRLQDEFGGTVVDEGIEPLNIEEAKNRRTYLEKVGQPSRIEILPETIARLRGHRIIVVDDILTSGETINAMQEELARHGLAAAGVAILGANQEAKPVYVTAIQPFAELLASANQTTATAVLEDIRLAHPFAYGNLLRKAWQDAQTEPKQVYELIRRKGKTLRETARLHVSGEHPPGAHAAAEGTGSPDRVAGILPLETPELAQTRTDGGGELHHEPALASHRGADGNPAPVALEDLVPYIDWSPFFHTWELRGVYPSILQHEKHGAQARELFADAQKLLAEIVAKKLLQLRAVYGLFPANAVGEDVELYTDESRTQVLAKFHFLRQQMEKGDNSPNHSLADFVAPKLPNSEPETRNSKLETRNLDFLGAFAVSSGFGLKELCDQFKAQHDDYNAIMAEALADRLAEAFAEYLHKRVRDEWGFGKLEQFTTDDFIAEKYRGIRPAAGYPACPDHTEKGTLWQLLDVENRTGIKLTESFAMWPGSSVSGLYFAHPQSKYFAVGKLDRDQVADLAQRKNKPLAEMERWLGPWLNYTAETAAPVGT